LIWLDIDELGFWLPYIVARALCSKFCWSIRYALTPIFGNDFPRVCDVQRQILYDLAIEYGTELSLDIDKDIVDAVNARQAVLEWSMILTGRDTTFMRKTSLPSLEKCWSTYISLASKNPILPPLKDPRKLAVDDTTSQSEYGQEVDKQQSLKADVNNLRKNQYTELIASPENFFSEIKQTRLGDVGSCSKMETSMKDPEVYRMFDWSDMKWSDMNAARSLMQLRYGVSRSRTL